MKIPTDLTGLIVNHCSYFLFLKFSRSVRTKLKNEGVRAINQPLLVLKKSYSKLNTLETSYYSRTAEPVYASLVLLKNPLSYKFRVFNPIYLIKSQG